MKTITKFLGGVLILLLLLTISPLSRQAHAAAVTINITGITNHSGAPIPVGSYYQLIRSADSAAGAPDSTGLPVGDTVVSSGTISTAGSFSGVASIASNNYIYIRVWETWNGSSSPVAGTYYGTSAPANVGAGFVYAYAPAGFSTTQRTPIPTPIITITPATLNPTVTQGQNAAAQSFTVGNSGTAPLTGYTVVSDVAWMTINPTGGTIAVGGAAVSHTITYNTAALTANAVGRITISAAEATTQTLTVNLTVNPPAAPTITTSSLPSGTVGIAYSQALAATGGTTPYTWSISAGTLPAGLTLSSAGVISGSPTTAQTASFTVQVVGGGTATRALSITINAIPAPNITTSSLSAGTVGVAYSQPLAATGGTTPYTWSISAGTLPAGLTLSSAGVISGSPTTAQTASFTVQVVGGGTATRPLSITINAVTVTLSSIAVTPANPTITVGATQQFVATGTYSDGTTQVIPSYVSWASATPATATITTAGLATAVVVGTSRISATLSGISGNTNLTVTAAPTPIIALTPATLNPTVTRGGNAAAQTFTIGNTGTAALNNYTVTSDVPWLTVSPNSGSIVVGAAAVTHTITYNTVALTANAVGRITVSAAGATTQTLTVNLIVNAPTAPSIIRLEMTSVPETAITAARVGDAISLVGSNFGATRATSTVTINGVAVTTFNYWNNAKIDIQVPTGAATGDVVVTVGDQASNRVALSIIPPIPPTPTLTITGPAAGGGYAGQTIVINGSGFGDAKGTSIVTIGNVTVDATAWSDNRITTAIPSGVSGSVAVRVTVGSTTQNGALNVLTTGAVIDDVEGGSVGTWARGLAQSGYFAYGTGITPDNTNITTNGPQAAATRHGARGLQIRYSYVSDWGGGWGATITRPLDLSSFDRIGFSIRWDGSTNEFKLSLKDDDGTVFSSTVTNVVLSRFSAYSESTIPRTSFAYDAASSSGEAAGAGIFNWARVTGYSLTYTTRGTSSNNHFIDSFYAGVVDFGASREGTVIPPPLSSEVLVTSLAPASGPAGARFKALGSGFGISQWQNLQNQGLLVFQNNSTGLLYPVEIINWSNTTIEAIVPILAPIGNYTLKVIRLAVVQGVTTAMESNPSMFSVTIGAMSAGTATIYPNPFNPLSTDAAKNTATVIFSPGSAASIGIYIFDSTAKLVYHAAVVGAGTASQTITWDGKDSNSSFVTDGLYLLRIVNEETKEGLARGKFLVVKK